jgi:60 kDa SS-A/Ro ribonucleoprotein
MKLLDQRVSDLLVAGEYSFLACLAVYAREYGKMKDMPVVITAYLAVHAPWVFDGVAPLVLTNGKSIRNFVQVLRSGRIAGRKSIPRVARRYIAEWLNEAPEHVILNGSVGSDPSLADVIRMVHPKPANPVRAGLLHFVRHGRYASGATFDDKYRARGTTLPMLVANYMVAAQGGLIAEDVRKLDFRLFERGYVEKRIELWKQLVPHMGWHALRMNLNTMERDGLFNEQNETADLVLGRLGSLDLIRRTPMMPYQVFTTLKAVQDWGNAYMLSIRSALMVAVGAAFNRDPAEGGAPRIECSVAVAVDNSGSMNSPVTGHRQGATTTVTCSEAAAVLAVGIVAGSRERARTLVFDTQAREVDVSRVENLREAVSMLNSTGGGTNVSSPLLTLMHGSGGKPLPDIVIVVSDYESWVALGKSERYASLSHQTHFMSVWREYRKRHPKAKLICVDMTPSATTQADLRAEGVYRVGGFSDAVFSYIDAVAKDEADAGAWEAAIMSMGEKIAAEAKRRAADRLAGNGVGGE